MSAFPSFRPQLSLGRIQSYIGLRMGSHHGGDVGWQSELRLVAMGPELLLQAVGSSLKVSLFAPFWTGMDQKINNVQAWRVRKTEA